MFYYFSTTSNVADDGEEDKSDDDKGQEQVVADRQDTQMANEMEASQSSTSSNRVTTSPPLTHCRRPTPGKRMHYGPNKRDDIEETLLKIIEKPEKKPEDEMFCLNLAASLRKILDPQKKAYKNSQFQQTLYKCMYGS